MQTKVCTHHRQEKSYLLLSPVMGGVIVSFSSKRILLKKKSVGKENSLN